ncbi:MAG TPA: hypothetical protein VGJ07_23970 [Rugosimonospora sp.]
MATVPPCLFEVLQTCRGAFGAPGFATFVALVVGALGAVGPRTVTGIWVATGLADRLHWSRAHRAAVTVAVDDTLFHRHGELVYGAA